MGLWLYINVVVFVMCCQLLNSKASKSLMQNDGGGAHGEEVRTWENSYGSSKKTGGGGGDSQSGSKWYAEDWAVQNYQYASGRGGLQDDDEDNWEYSASGSGDGGYKPGIKYKPGKSSSNNQHPAQRDDDLTFDQPYITPKSDLAYAGSGSSSHQLTRLSVACTTILALFLWLNG